MDLANTAATSGAEVPIPVFADVSNTAPPQPSGQGAVDSVEILQKKPVPTISITKPPAPRPVDLPTHDEISPVGPNFDLHSGDIESTGSLMQEIGHHSRTASEFSNPGHQRDLSSAPKSTQNSVSGDIGPPNASTTSPSGVADLLGDSAPAVSASQTNPSPSERRSPRVIPPPLLLPDERTPIEGDETESEGDETDSEGDEIDSEGDEIDSEVEEIAATVRLVGSGGDVGLEDGQGQSDEAGDSLDQAEASSSTSYFSDESSSSLPMSRDSHSKTTSVHSLRGGQSSN